MLDSDIDKQVIAAMNNYDYDKYTAKDVENAINARLILHLRILQHFLSPAALPYFRTDGTGRLQIEKEKTFW